MTIAISSSAIIGVGAHTPQRGGASAIAYAHAWALRDLGVPLSAIAARSVANRDGFTGEFPGTRAYADWRELLAAERPELVSICAWPSEREAMALEALRHGARILWIEKPLALNLDAARRILDAAEAAGARVFVHHQRRFGHPFRLLAAGCAAGRLGQMRSVTVTHPSPNLLDFGCHLVDAALSCLPGRAPVAAFGAAVATGRRHHEALVEDEACGWVRFDDGAMLHLVSGASAGDGAPAIRVDGSHGFAELGFSPGPGEAGILRARWQGEAALDCPLLLEGFHHDYVDRNINVVRFLHEVLEATASGRPSPVDGREALRSLSCILGVLESAAQRRPVALPCAQPSSPIERLAGQ